jgi:hypothetical protein
MKPSTSPMLRWILGHGVARISCEINQNPDKTFNLRVVPSWSERPRIVGRFAGVVAAMERHAEIAGTLRDSGWQVIERTSRARHVAA